MYALQISRNPRVGLLSTAREAKERGGGGREETTPRGNGIRNEIVH